MFLEVMKCIIPFSISLVFGIISEIFEYAYAMQEDMYR